MLKLPKKKREKEDRKVKNQYDLFITEFRNTECENILHDELSSPEKSVNDIALFVFGYEVDSQLTETLLQCASVLECECEKFGKLLEFVFYPHESASVNTKKEDSKYGVHLKSNFVIVMANHHNWVRIKEEILSLCNRFTEPIQITLVIQSSCVIKDVIEELQVLHELEIITYENCIGDNLKCILSKLREAITTHCTRLQTEEQLHSEHELEILSSQRFSNGLSCDIVEESLQCQILYDSVCSSQLCLSKKIINGLTAHVTQPGPVSPLLVLGPSGSGRTTVLSSWVSQMQDHFIIVPYFVRSKSSNTSNAALLMRRILIQLLEKINSSSVLSSNYSHMILEFPHWLEKIASKLNTTAVLLLDSIDLCQNVEEELFWLLDPLPVNIKVIISCHPHHCPSSWSLWPTLHLESPTVDVADKILNEELQSLSTCNVNEGSQEKIVAKLNDCNELSYLSCDIFCKSAVRVQPEDDLDLTLEKLSRCNCTELFKTLLKYLASTLCDNSAERQMKESLSFIRASCEGLPESSLPFLVNGFCWDWWNNMKSCLKRYNVLRNCCGMLFIKHEQCKLGIDHLCFEEEQRSITDYRIKLVDYYRARLKTSYFIPACIIDDFLKLLVKLNQLEELTEWINDARVFCSLYTRGRICELQSYFNMTNVEPSLVTLNYSSSLENLKENALIGENVPTVAEIANIYEAVGLYLKDLGLLSQAVHPLQRTLELREMMLDPDHPLVGEILNELATLHCQWGKFSTAETLMKQALDIYEETFGKEHYLVIKEMTSLIFLYRQMGKTEAASVLQEQVESGKRFHCTPCLYLTATSLISRLRLNTTLNDVSEAAANNFLETGMKLFASHNFELAERNMLVSLKMKEQLYGHSSLHLCQTLNNLAGVLWKRKKFEKAEEMYKRALDIRMQNLPMDDIAIVNVIARLGFLYQEQEKLGEYILLYEQVLEKQKTTLGDTHACTASTMVNLAILLSQQNKYAEALILYEEALNIFTNIYGENHVQVIVTMKNLALLHYKQGYFAVAANLYKKAMEINK